MRTQSETNNQRQFFNYPARMQARTNKSLSDLIKLLETQQVHF